MPVVLAREADQPARGHHHRRGDVVLHLDLVGGDEVLPQLVRPPGAVLLAADPEIIGDEPPPLVLELVSGRAVDDVDAEVAPPIGAPFRPVKALDDEDQGPDVVRNALEPGVVLRCELGGAGREQLDHRAERAIGRQERPRVVVPVDDRLDQRHVLLEAPDVERPGQHRVDQALADLRLAAARNGAGLVAEGALRNRPDQPPARRLAVLGHADLVAARVDVDAAGQELQVLLLALADPFDVLAVDVDLHVLRHVVDLGIDPVGRIARGVVRRPLADQRQHLREPVVGAHDPHLLRHEALTQTEGGERQRATRVLLLGQAEQVCAVADLGLDLLLAVPEIVVGQDRDHHALDAARGQLEGPAVVVQLALVRPAHARGPLGVGRFAHGRQADVLLAEAREVRREDHAPAVAGPAVDIERGVVPGEIGVAGVAEDALDEVQVRDQAAGHEEPHLRALLRRDLGHRRAHQWPQQQRHHGLDGLRPVARERKAHELGRRAQRLLEQPQVGHQWHPQLVRGNRETTLRHVEDALGRPAIVDGVVQHAVVEAIARYQLVVPGLRVDRQ